MVRRGHLSVLAVLFLSCGAGAAVEPIDQTKWLDAAQDSTGLVWGILQQGEHRLFTHDGSGWHAVDWKPGSASRPFIPSALTRSADGAVIIHWTDNAGARSNRHWLSQHRGTESREIGEFGATLTSPILFVDSKGAVWITQTGHEIYRFKPGGPLELMYSLKAEELERNDVHRDRNSNRMNQVHALEDNTGTIWLWSDAGFSKGESLKQWIAYDGTHFTAKIFPGLPPVPRCYFLTQEDGAHFLAAFQDEAGVYRLDVKGLTATRIDTDARALKKISEVLCVDGTDYFIGTDRGDKGVWTFQPDHELKKIAGSLENAGWAIPMLRSPDGLLLGSFNRGILFLPEGASNLESFDWRRNFPFRKVDRLFAIGGNRLLAVTFSNGSSVVPMPPWPAPQANPGVEVFQMHEAPIGDNRGNVWAFDPHLLFLNKWDGRSWTAYPLPPHKWDRPEIAADSAGRIWLLLSGSCRVFDPTSGAWKEETSERAAFERELRADPKFSLNSTYSFRFCFSGDGRIAFSNRFANLVQYFDGKGWLQWSSDEVHRGTPQFEKDGHLIVVSGNNFWRFDGKGWPRANPDPVRLPAPPQAGAIPPAVRSLAPNNDWIVPDQDESFWFTAGHRLYRARPGVQVPVFAEDQANPFVDGRELRAAVLDGAGDVFLMTNAWQECVFVRACSAPPQTRVEVKVHEDSMQATLRSDGPGRHWFEWRLDGSNWNSPAETTKVNLESLPNGRHFLEARAIDDYLQIDRRGAKSAFIVAVDRKKQVTGAINQLRGPDYSQREKAVRLLVKQPALALPALKQARAGTNDGQRWWIDAAIQEIERKSPVPGTGLSPH